MARYEQKSPVTNRNKGMREGRNKRTNGRTNERTQVACCVSDSPAPIQTDTIRDAILAANTIKASLAWPHVVHLSCLVLPCLVRFCRRRIVSVA
mmetsp:Transcript_21931/g.51976  ORF Transcript_21931/g.51976 Transcript_21931/m.51976 type:complete len:94 (-) Transcript_21931:131-412(-)